MTISALQHLDGKCVLVRSNEDGHNPPVAVWGWIHVVNTPGAPHPKFELVMEFPDMYNEPAHERVLELGSEGLARLLASERNGTFEFVVDGPLNRPSPEPHRVNPDSIKVPH